MVNMIIAEHLKLKHTFGRKVTVVAPVITLLLALVFTAGVENGFPTGAWNWWYVMLLPGMLAVLCYLSVKKDKKMKYYNYLTLPISPQKGWLWKNIYCGLGLVIANYVIFIGTSIGGYFLGTTISTFHGFFGAGLLSIAYLWEIPLLLFLCARFGMFVSIFTSIALAVCGTVTLADTSLWWTFPPSIPIRLMCPVLGILPNGLPVPMDSTLSHSNVILPGLILSLIWFLGLTFLTSRWFQNMEVKG